MPTIINGTGTIAGLQSGGLTDNIITQADLDNNVTSTGPAFSAYVGSSHALTQNAFTIIQCGTEEHDIGGYYNSTGATVGGIPAYSFQPGVAGYYLFTASIQPTSDASQLIAIISKNGSEIKRGGGGGGGGAYARSVTVSAVVYMNGSTDYINFQTYTSSAGLSATAGVTTSYFQGTLVRAATVVPSATTTITTSNGPAFSAYRAAAAATLTQSVASLIALDAENFDTAGAFNTSNPWQFQPTVAGYYQINFGVYLTQGTNANAASILYKNGASLVQGTTVPSTGLISAGSTIVFLNGTSDYLQLWAIGTGTTPAVQPGANTYMNGFLARLP